MVMFAHFQWQYILQFSSGVILSRRYSCSSYDLSVDENCFLGAISVRV
jgi:hypothetical protein